MTPADLRDEVATYDGLTAILKRWQALCGAGWESDEPDPEPWRALAADVFSLRASLAADHPLLEMVTAIEGMLALRISLEESPRPSLWSRLRRRRIRPLRESRRTFDHLIALRLRLLARQPDSEV